MSSPRRPSPPAKPPPDPSSTTAPPCGPQSYADVLGRQTPHSTPSPTTTPRPAHGPTSSSYAAAASLPRSSKSTISQNPPAAHVSRSAVFPSSANPAPPLVPLQQQLLRTERGKLQLPLAQQLLRLHNASKTECYSNGGTVLLLSNPVLAALISKLTATHPLVTTIRALSLLPPDTVASLHQLRSCIADLLPGMAAFRATTRQQDAHEFVLSLVHALEDALRATGRPKELRALQIFLQMRLTKYSECVAYGALHSHQRTEVETVLSLPVVHPHTGQPLLTLENCLHHYLAKETLQYDCEQCTCKEIIQYTTVARQPPVLLLHLNRFSNTLRKIGHTIAFRTNLKLQPDLPPYILTCALLHFGTSLTSGHYGCVVRCCSSGRYF